jgi:hypothetical protein
MQVPDTVKAFTPEEARALWEHVERELPELWHTCYPRMYSEPKCGQYYSPKEPARQIAAVAMKIMEGWIGKSEQYEFVAASHLVKYSVPMFWLGHDMAVAIRQTMPPGKIHWYDMNMSFPACIFMLPKGSLVHPTEGPVTFIGYIRLREGETHTSQLVKGRPYGSLNGGMTFLAHTTGHSETSVHGHFYHWNLPLDFYGPSVSIPDIDATPVKDSAWEHGSGVPFYKPEMTDEDNQFMLEVVHMAFGAILLMQERPDLITTGSLQKRVVDKHKGKVREFWTPNVLGENYRIKREHADQGGTHASPRFHWVRGFYREQAYGPKRELRKQQWIEPYTRGI